MPLTFTSAVARYLELDPSTPDTVTYWLRAEGDAEQRAMKFAANLAEDFIAAFQLPVPDEQPELALLNVLSRHAIDQVNWRRVAEKLLRHFGQPAMIGMHNYHVPPRLLAAVCWHGPVN
jgi:hypothetical protein